LGSIPAEGEEIMEFWPIEGDKCPDCKGEIKFIGMKGYDNGYYCEDCGREWWYD
jgi:tRNA(Ile2) C34 agmatinyltransferase TiaS